MTVKPFILQCNACLHLVLFQNANGEPLVPCQSLQPWLVAVMHAVVGRFHFPLTLLHCPVMTWVHKHQFRKMMCVLVAQCGSVSLCVSVCLCSSACLSVALCVSVALRLCWPIGSVYVCFDRGAWNLQFKPFWYVRRCFLLGILIVYRFSSG